MISQFTEIKAKKQKTKPSVHNYYEWYMYVFTLLYIVLSIILLGSIYSVFIIMYDYRWAG